MISCSCLVVASPIRSSWRAWAVDSSSLWRASPSPTSSSWRACAVAGYHLESRPIFEGDAGRRAYLYGQAPGIVEAEEGRPWRGRAGRTLRAWLGRVREQPGYMNDLAPYPPNSHAGASRSIYD